MPRLIYKTVFLLLIFFSGAAHCVNIENFDAFQQNDNLAVRDADTGLVWLDFGVNNGESINSVVGNLNGVYSGWRLPAEAEVINLWEKLTTSDLTGIFDFWGANKTRDDNLPYLAWGYFVDDEGYLGAAFIKEDLESLRQISSNSYTSKKVIAGIEKRVIDIKYDGSAYYLFNLDGAAEISTLLVKKVEVNEPPVFFLLIFVVAVFIRKYIF